tara:strand:+ start:2402 stop:2662 length:261 start_codon:yes stop_codon:yes gene_type:complete
MTQEEKDYGTPITADELVGHYEMGFLAKNRFKDLLEEYTKSQFETFFDDSAEDYILWDEQEQGPYPTQRIFDAMKKFKDQQPWKKN